MGEMFLFFMFIKEFRDFFSLLVTELFRWWVTSATAEHRENIWALAMLAKLLTAKVNINGFCHSYYYTFFYLENNQSVPKQVYGIQNSYSIIYSLRY